MAPQSFRRFAYATLLSNKDPSAWHTRDGAAFAETSAALCELDWRYAGLIFNYPSSGGRPAQGPDAFEFVTANEWLVENTRPPLDDNTHSDFRFVHRSDSALEGAVFAETGVNHYPRKFGSSQFFSAKHLLSTLRDQFDFIEHPHRPARDSV